MKIIDRYIAKYFLINILIMFFACVGLIIMVEMMGNAGDLVESVKSRGGQWHEVAWAMIDFYGPKAFLYYQYMAGIMPVGAAGFTLVGMIRHREIAALLASGISLYRIALPVFVLGFIFSSVGMAINQELVMPELAHLLGRRTKDLRTGKVTDFELQFVPDARGRLFTTGQFNAQDLTIGRLTIHEREIADDPDPNDPSDNRYGRATHRIEAEQAGWSEHRHGWVLTDGRRYPLEGQKGDLLAPGADRLKYEPIDFVQTELTPKVALMNHRARFRQFLSLGELNELIANPPKVVNVSELQRIRHARFSQIFINLLIMAIGIPFFMVRFPVGMLLPGVKALGLSLGAWGFAMLMIQAGPPNIPPALAAWMPVILLLPLAYHMLESVET